MLTVHVAKPRVKFILPKWHSKMHLLHIKLHDRRHRDGRERRGCKNRLRGGRHGRAEVVVGRRHRLTSGQHRGGHAGRGIHEKRSGVV